jgi:hypothetical protein
VPPNLASLGRGRGTPRIVTPPRASASIVSLIPEEPAKLKIANQIVPSRHLQHLFHELRLKN